MQSLRPLAVPTYLVAAVLVLFPVVDTSLGLLPLAPGEVSWRFGAIGLFSRALMTPLLGLLIACAVALSLNHLAILRILSIVSAGLVVAILGTLALFLLDALQMRAQVRPDAALSFDIATGVALGKYAVAAAVTSAVAVTGWRASASPSASLRRNQPEDPHALVVRSRSPL
jgi:hypothetical protein